MQHTEGSDKGPPLSAPDSITAVVTDHDGVTVLSIGGEIDLVTAPALEEAIGAVVADNPAALVIDLSGVEFLGSVGLKILAATYEKLGTAAEFGVVAQGPATRRPIHLTGLDKTFPLYPALDDALTGVRDGKLNR
ncbi:Anti-sigma-F factor antagonist RsfB [Mycobacterium marinum]|nr:Anti-sigma-F factor antagonist RsfB [Mycobacterium marinum]